MERQYWTVLAIAFLILIVSYYLGPSVLLISFSLGLVIVITRFLAGFGFVISYATFCTYLLKYLSPFFQA
ncbi:MAG: hypothetical protein ACTSX9_06455 [Candidatus Njordarchaeales archaeon]